MPGASPVTVIEVPVPVDCPPGVCVRVHVPVDGSPLRMTLPVATAQVGCVLVPIVGAAGFAYTVRVYVAEAATQRPPTGLLVVTVMTTVLPASNTAGV